MGVRGAAGKFDKAPEQYDADGKVHDFRSLVLGEDMGWRMQTRKRLRDELQQMDMERPTEEQVLAKKKVKTSSTVGKKSGRSWKAPQVARASSQVKSAQSTSWEEKMKKKRELEMWKRKRAELRNEAKEIANAEKKRRQEKKKRKEENEKRTGMKLQKISNPKKLKNMSKKQFKKVILTTADVSK